jgi:hypothetical protein
MVSMPRHWPAGVVEANWVLKDAKESEAALEVVLVITLLGLG